jgi:hypothetical protein
MTAAVLLEATCTFPRDVGPRNLENFTSWPLEKFNFDSMMNDFSLLSQKIQHYSTL